MVLKFAEILPHLSEPIDDLALRAPGKYDEKESILRCKIAAAYRLADLFGWTNGIYSHLTVRTADRHILLNPFGMLYYEITASSLIKVDLNGRIIDPGATNFGINDRGYTLHSAIHGARHDCECVMHLHTPEVMGFTALKTEFLQLFQESQIVQKVAFLKEYGGSLTNLDERKQIVDALGDCNIMLLRNHGFVCCGRTVEEAFNNTYNLINAMTATVKLAEIKHTRVMVPSDEAIKRTANCSAEGIDTPGMHWPPGELEWESHMRVLDKMGLKTGHKYRLRTFE